MSTYDSTGVLSLGTGSATAVRIGRTGITTTFASGSTVDFLGATIINATFGPFGATTFTGLVTAQAGVSITGGGFSMASGQAATLNGTTTLTLGTGALTSGGPITTSGNISTTGTGNITSATSLLGANGTVAAPTHSFTAFPDSGLYYNTAAGSAALASGASDRLILYHQKTGLTNAATNNLIVLNGLGTNSRAGVLVTWLLEVADAGATSQTLFGTALVAAQSTAGVVTGNVSSFDSSAVGGGTLSALWSLDTAVAGQVTLRVTPVSSLTPTVLRIAMNVTAVNATANTVAFV